MSDPFAELRDGFFEECEELLESLGDALRSMRNGETDPECVNVAFRAVHSMKGGAGAFSMDGLVDFTHAFEEALETCRSDPKRIAPDTVDILLRCSDHTADLVRAEREGVQVDAGRSADLTAQLTSLSDRVTQKNEEASYEPLALDPSVLTEASSDDFSPAWRIRLRPKPELYDLGMEPLQLLKSLKEVAVVETTLEFDAPEDETAFSSPGGRLTFDILITGLSERSDVEEYLEFFDDVADLSIEEVSSEIEPDEIEEGSAATLLGPALLTKVATTVRVDIRRIDRLVNLVGELVIQQSMLALNLDAVLPQSHSETTAKFEECQNLTRALQESVMMIRAQPVKPLFQRMERIVREASDQTGKDVRVALVGEATELDKTVIESLAEPLTHMIRNAVDHGIEDADTRRNSGKPEIGTIKLSAKQASGRIIIEVADDGGGIDRQAVLEKARRLGLVSPGSTQSNSDIDQLLLRAGFSSRDEVTALSGRGVGLDVVRTQIADLGGKITISSARGQGTVFTLSLPLTLALLDGMVVTLGSESLVIPIADIIETTLIGSDHLARLRPDQEVLRIRGSVYPVVDLGVALGFRHSPPPSPGRTSLIVKHERGAPTAILVDAIVDQRQVVVKGLPSGFRPIPGISAATILGDGKIALIADPTAIVSAEPRPPLRRCA